MNISYPPNPPKNKTKTKQNKKQTKTQNSMQTQKYNFLPPTIIVIFIYKSKTLLSVVRQGVVLDRELVNEIK